MGEGEKYKDNCIHFKLLITKGEEEDFQVMSVDQSIFFLAKGSLYRYIYQLPYI